MKAKTVELLYQCRTLVREEWGKATVLSRVRYLKDLLNDLDAAIQEAEK